MARSDAHLSDDDLAGLDAASERSDSRVRAHVAACETCRRRHDELFHLRAMLAIAGRREGRPTRDAVPSAMMRLRLRRHGITNANELLQGIAALMRGLGSLFSLPTADDRHE